MAEEKIIIDIELRASQSQQEATKLKQSIVALSTARRDLLRELKKLQKEEQQLNTTRQNTQKELNSLRAAGKENTAEFRQLSQQLQLTDTRLAEIAAESTRTANELSVNEQRTSEARRSYRLLQRELSAASGSLDEQRAKLSKLNRQYDSFRVGIDGTEQDLQSLESEIQDLTRNIAEQEQRTGRFQRSVGNYANSIREAFRGAIPGAIALTSGVAALSAVISGSIKQIGETINVYKSFELQMARLKAISGATEEQFARLEEQAKTLGGTTEFTASQVGDLQTELAKLGFDPGEIESATGSILDLGTAFGGDLGRNAAVVGSTIRAFGLEASDAGRVADVMAASFANSALDLSKFETSMATVAPVAEALGFSLEGTTSLLGSLADAGFDASTAGTSVRNILLNLADPAGDLSQELGRNITSTEELVPALKELEARGIDLASSLELTDKRSVAAFNRFIKGADDVSALSQELNNASGTANRFAEGIRDTLSGNIDSLSSSIEAARIELGEALAPTINSIVLLLTRMVRGIITFIGILRELPKFVKENKEELAVLGLAILALNANAILAAASTLKLIAVQKAQAISTRAAAIAQGVLNVIMTANPIGLVITAIGLLVAAFIALYKRSVTVRAGIQGLFNAIKTIGGNFIQGVIDQFLGLGEVIEGVFTLDFEKIKAGAARALDGIAKQTFRIGEGAADAFNEGFDGKIKTERLEAARTLTGDGKTDDSGVADAGGDFEEEEKKATNFLSKSDSRNARKKAIDSRKAIIEAELLEVKKGSEQELALRRELIELARDSALAAANLTEGERVLIAAKAEADIQALREAQTKADLEREQAALKTRLLQIEEGSNAEFELRKQLAENSRDIELAADSLTAEQRLLIRAEAAVEIQEIENERISAQIAKQLEAFDIEEANLRIRLAQRLITEAEFDGLLFEQRQAKLEAEIAQLEEGELAKIEKEAELAELRAERLSSIDEQENAAKLESIKVEEDEQKKKQQLDQARLSIAQNTSGAIISLLGDEAEESQAATVVRKGVAATEVGLNLQRQLSAINLASAKIALETIPTVPVGVAAAATYRTINTIAAIAGAIAAGAQIASFAEGGPTSDISVIESHAPGGPIDAPTLGLIGEAGPEWVAPNWMIKSPKLAPLFSQLENIRQLKAVPFADGGFSGLSNSIPDVPDGGFIERQLGGTGLDPEVIREAVRSGMMEAPAPRVLVSDINAGQNRQAQVEDEGNL